MDVVKDAHTAIFSGQMGCGKTHLMLNLIESEYKGHFEYIIVICPTIKVINNTYLTRSWIRSDTGVFLIEPGDKLFEWIRVLSGLLSGYTTLFILDDVIADESLDSQGRLYLDLSYLWKTLRPLSLDVNPVVKI